VLSFPQRVEGLAQAPRTARISFAFGGAIALNYCHRLHEMLGADDTRASRAAGLLPA